MKRREPVGAVIRTIWLRDGTVITGVRRTGQPDGPAAYFVDNEEGRHRVMVDSVVRVLDSPSKPS